MCDPECRKRFLAMELQTIQIATDVKWIKKLVIALVLTFAGIFGIDLTGLVV